MLRITGFLVLATNAIWQPFALGGDAAGSQYLLHVKLTQERSDDVCKNPTGKVLAAPILVTVEGREAVYLVGGKTTIGDQQVEHGTLLKVRIRSSDANTASVSGMIELSTVGKTTDDLLTRMSTSMYFKRTVELGKTCRFELPKTDGNEQSLELSVERVAGPLAEPIPPHRAKAAVKR